MLKFIGVGDNVVDKYQNKNTMFPGGNTVNFSAYVRKFGVASAYLGVLGSDKAATHILSVLNELGVDTSHCRKVDGPNGYATINLADGDRVFVEHNWGGVQKDHPIVFTEEDYNYIKEFDLLHTHTSIASSLPEESFQRFKHDNIAVSYDFSDKWTQDQLNLLCPYLTFGFFSCSHLNTPEILELMKIVYDLGTNIVVCTRGVEGSMLFDGQKIYCQQAFSVKALDTLGAGDSFISAFLSTYLGLHKKHAAGHQINLEEREIIEECLKNGAMFAAETCMVYGAFGHGTTIA